MTLKEQMQRFPIGRHVVATEGCEDYYRAGDSGVVLKHYGKGSVYVRFSRRSSAKVSEGGTRDWFVAVESLEPQP